MLLSYFCIAITDTNKKSKHLYAMIRASLALSSRLESKIKFISFVKILFCIVCILFPLCHKPLFKTINRKCIDILPFC